MVFVCRRAIVFHGGGALVPESMASTQLYQLYQLYQSIFLIFSDYSSVRELNCSSYRKFILDTIDTVDTVDCLTDNPLRIDNLPIDTVMIQLIQSK